MSDAATKLAEEIKARHDAAIDDAEGCPFCTKGRCAVIRAADMLLELAKDTKETPRE